MYPDQFLIKIKGSKADLQLKKDNKTFGEFYFDILTSSNNKLDGNINEKLEGLLIRHTKKWAIIYAEEFDEEICKALVAIHESKDFKFFILDEVSNSSIIEKWKNFLRDGYETKPDNLTIQRVRVEYRGRVNEKNLEKTARNHMQNNNWSQAADVYEQLIEKASNPESKNVWERSLKMCRVESDLSRLFNQGQGAIEHKEWQKAQDSLLKIIGNRITYQKDRVWTTELLDRLAKEMPHIPLEIPPPFFKSIISVENINNLKIKCSNEMPGITTAAYDREGKFIIVISQEKVYILDPLNLNKTKEIEIKTDNIQIESFALSPDGEILALGMRDGSVQLRQDGYKKLLHPPVRKHTKSVNAVAFSANGEILASGGDGCIIRLRKVKDNNVFVASEDADGPIRDIAFSPNGEIIASASRVVQLWRVQQQNMSLLSPLPEQHTGNVWKVFFSPNGKILASASSDKTVCLWDVDTGDLLSPPLKGHDKSVDTIAFSSDGTILASGSRDRTLRLWRADNGELMRIIEGFKDSVNSIDFHSDGTAMVTISNRRIVQLWGL